MDILEFGDPGAQTVLVQPVGDHDLPGIRTEIGEIRKRTDEPFLLTAFRVGDWRKDLSPWRAPAAAGGDAFGDGAAGTLSAILSRCGDPAKTYFLGGYSLAGLFALWAAFQTDRFRGVAAASPSVWFPGFPDYAAGRQALCGCVYLSLGEKEEKTNHPVLSQVGDGIRAVFRCLERQGIPCTLEWKPGNHFRDVETRTAKAFAWVLERQKGRRPEELKQ